MKTEESLRPESTQRLSGHCVWGSQLRIISLRTWKTWCPKPTVGASWRNPNHTSSLPYESQVSQALSTPVRISLWCHCLISFLQKDKDSSETEMSVQDIHSHTWPSCRQGTPLPVTLWSLSLLPSVNSHRQEGLCWRARLSTSHTRMLL